MSDLQTSCDETTQIVPGQDLSRNDMLLIALGVLIRSGDAIEYFLPGVITQEVACELALSSIQEGILGIMFYVTVCPSFYFGALLSDRFGRRHVMLASLYISIIFMVFCALVPNYSTLLLSRALTGVCVGLNTTTLGVYISESASSRDVYTKGTSLGSFCISAGGGWIALVAYVLLESVGWRIFVLLTSVPVFIPPILMLHCCLEDSVPGNSNVVNTETEAGSTDIPTTVDNFNIRLFMTSTFSFINDFQNFAAILLLPALIRLLNGQDLDLMKGTDLTGERSNSTTSFPTDHYCASAVHGTQFLIIALVTGGANSLGGLAGYLISGKGSFRIAQGLLAMVITMCYGVLMLRSGMVVTALAMGICQIAHSMMRLEMILVIFDSMYFGTERLNIASATAYFVGGIGGLLGELGCGFPRASAGGECHFWVQCR